MRIAIFSDVHGNLPALELFLKHSKDGCDTYLFLGDAVNYGPWSNECVALIADIAPLASIMGNHETYFINGKYTGTNPIPIAFFEECYPHFRAQNIIKTYQESIFLEGFFITHTIDGRTLFADSDVVLTQNTMVGHSHKQYLTEKNGFIFLNPGSVGQNRTYIDTINYTIWDTEKQVFYQKHFLYDSNCIINELESRRFPPICVNYYKNKQNKP